MSEVPRMTILFSWLQSKGVNALLLVQPIKVAVYMNFGEGISVKCRPIPSKVLQYFESIRHGLVFNDSGHTQITRGITTKLQTPFWETVNTSRSVIQRKVEAFVFQLLDNPILNVTESKIVFLTLFDSIKTWQKF